MDAPTGLEAIPHPPKTVLLGNLLTLNLRTPVQDLMTLAREYGPIFWLDMRGRVLVMVSTAALADELCDEKRFDKSVRGPLRRVRRFGGDGLFTARTQEANWAKAHNILLPAFSERAMQSYHATMLGVAEELVLKWGRFNADDEVDVVRDMTALTLDTIGLCGFGYRFNSFYRDGNHPFVDAMIRALSASMEARGLPLEDVLQRKRERQVRADVAYMNGMVDRIVKERQASGADLAERADLLNYMLANVDRRTGQRLDDVNIRYQILTFLIAGHETTSGLLSFALYALLNHPEVLARAVQEVDRVLGPDPAARPTYAQVKQLTYVSQVLKETLRLWPTAPTFSVYAYEPTLIGGRYTMKPDYHVTVLTPMVHRDPAVWGERAEVFDPDQFTAAAERARPANAYKPFGNGQRACIGRQFALHEAALVLGMILHRFTLIDHTRYALRIKETLTLKPEGLRIKVRRREMHHRPATTPVAVASAPIAVAPAAEPDGAHDHGTPLLVLYGSNLGTSEELARRIAQDADGHGFATTVAPLDAYVGQLPREGAVLIATATYNGTPPDNAVRFCQWLRAGELGPTSLAGVRYAVFGCGHRDWAATFQAIPQLIDAKLAEFGAERIYARGEGDGREDFDGQFQAWYRPLWPALGAALDIGVEIPEERAEPLYVVEVVPGERLSPFVGSLGATPMRVAVNRELHTKHGPQPSERSTRHIELELPTGVAYRAGDHLGVVPHNPDALVRRVAARFGFAGDGHVRLRKTTVRKTFLPTDEPISLFRLLGDYVELQDVATRSQIRTLAEHTQCPPDKARLLALAGDDDASVARYRAEVLAGRKSLFDLLDECPACELPFNVYLELLSPLAPRYYSISSSPLVDARRCAITVAVVSAPARSGRGTYEGVCSNYLLQQGEGSVVYAVVKDTGSAFRLPDDPAVPIIMIGAGTGLAPFRGFLQERAALAARGASLGPSLLFFGCRHPGQDFIYETELRGFEAQGVTALHVACSRVDESQKTYVQHLVRERGDDVWRLLEAGAVAFVCGDASRMAPDVRRAFAAIYRDRTGAVEAAAEAWVDDLVTRGRYLVDVWASS